MTCSTTLIWELNEVPRIERKIQNLKQLFLPFLNLYLDLGEKSNVSANCICSLLKIQWCYTIFNQL